MSENTGSREGKLTAEEIAVLEKAKRPVIIANRFRLFFLFASVVLVIAIYIPPQNAEKQATHSLTQAIVSRLAHDREDSRFTHACVPKTAVFCRVGKKEKR